MSDFIDDELADIYIPMYPDGVVGCNCVDLFMFDTDDEYRAGRSARPKLTELQKQFTRVAKNIARKSDEDFLMWWLDQLEARRGVLDDLRAARGLITETPCISELMLKATPYPRFGVVRNGRHIATYDCSTDWVAFGGYRGDTGRIDGVQDVLRCGLDLRSRKFRRLEGAQKPTRLYCPSDHSLGFVYEVPKGGDWSRGSSLFLVPCWNGEREAENTQRKAWATVVPHWCVKGKTWFDVVIPGVANVRDWITESDESVYWHELYCYQCRDFYYFNANSWSCSELPKSVQGEL